MLIGTISKLLIYNSTNSDNVVGNYGKNM